MEDKLDFLYKAFYKATRHGCYDPKEVCEIEKCFHELLNNIKKFNKPTKVNNKVKNCN